MQVKKKKKITNNSTNFSLQVESVAQEDIFDFDKERIVKAILIHNAKTESINKSSNIYNPLIVGITLPNDVIKERINKRLKERLKTGMIEEVESLINLYYF